MIRRKSSVRKVTVGSTLAAVVALAFATSNAFAASGPYFTGTDSVSDEQYIGYGVTGGTDDTVVNITTPQEDPDSPTGEMCAMIYVLDAHQLLEECCGCLVTPDGLLTERVKSELFSNTKFNAPPQSVGVIRLVGGVPNGCEGDPSDTLQGCASDTSGPGTGNLSEVCDATGGTYTYGQYHGNNPLAGPGFNYPYHNNHFNSGFGLGSFEVIRNLRAWGTHNQNGSITESEFEENPITQNDANSLAETCGDIQSSGSSRSGVCACGVGG
jgi:hypothetical protein